MQPLTFGQEPMTAIAAAATAVENAMDALLGAVPAMRAGATCRAALELCT